MLASALFDVARLGVFGFGYFAETKVARSPGRTPATLKHAKHSNEENVVLQQLRKFLEI